MVTIDKNMIIASIIYILKYCRYFLFIDFSIKKYYL